MLRDQLKDFLSKSEAVIVFEKKDGTIREMRCTLKPEYLPPLKGSNSARSMEVLPVWDLDKNAWRSFRLDSIKDIK